MAQTAKNSKFIKAYNEANKTEKVLLMTFFALACDYHEKYKKIINNNNKGVKNGKENTKCSPQ